MIGLSHPCALGGSRVMVQSPFVSYAQNGEDVLLWRALKNVQCGFYIDVGAQDPIVDSVTRAFYERGWHGINIEPVAQWYDRLVKDRPHDTNLRLAVSNQPGTIKLFEVEESGLSTSDPEFARRHEAEGHTLHEQVVECATLDQICANNTVKTVHFLKIDCEGAEKSALEGFSLSEVRPWVILLEATEPNSTKPTWHEWEHLLTGRGYQYVFFDGLNRYYLADEHMDLAPAFDAPVNVFDKVRKFSEVSAQELIDRLHGEMEGLKGAATVAKLQAELNAIAAARDMALAERNAVTAERDAVSAERDRVAAERDQVAIQHEKVADERDRMAAERDDVMLELDRVASERDTLTAQRDALVSERDALTAERDDLCARHSALQQEDDGRKRELERVQASLAELLTSHSWRITAPLRAISRACRRVYRRGRRLAYLALRPFAHWAKPMLLWLAHKPAARKWVVGIFGRHSGLVNTTRLFLIGAPAPSPPIELVAPSPELVAEGESLSARGREVLSTLEEMQMQAKGETQRASRT